MESNDQQFKDKLNKYRLEAHRIWESKNIEDDTAKILANTLFGYLYELYRCGQIDEDRALSIMKRYYLADTSYLMQITSYTLVIRDLVSKIPEAEALIGVNFKNINPLDLFYVGGDYRGAYDRAFVIMLVGKILDSLYDKPGGVELAYNIIMQEAAKLGISNDSNTILFVKSWYRDRDGFDYFTPLAEYINLKQVIMNTGGILPSRNCKNKEVRFFYNKMKNSYIDSSYIAKARLIGLDLDLYGILIMNTLIRLAKFLLMSNTNMQIDR